MTAQSEITKRCAYCSDAAVLYHGLVINPPMCPVHYDLSVLVEFMRARKLPLTVEGVQVQLARGRANSDQWVLTADQVPQLLSDLVPEEVSAVGGQPSAVK